MKTYQCRCKDPLFPIIMIMRKEDDHLNNKPDNENKNMLIKITSNKFDRVGWIGWLSRIL